MEQKVPKTPTTTTTNHSNNNNNNHSPINNLINSPKNSSRSIKHIDSTTSKSKIPTIKDPDGSPDKNHLKVKRCKHGRIIVKDVSKKNSSNPTTSSSSSSTTTTTTNHHHQNQQHNHPHHKEKQRDTNQHTNDSSSKSTTSKSSPSKQHISSSSSSSREHKKSDHHRHHHHHYQQQQQHHHSARDHRHNLHHHHHNNHSKGSDLEKQIPRSPLTPPPKTNTQPDASPKKTTTTTSTTITSPSNTVALQHPSQSIITKQKSIVTQPLRSPTPEQTQNSTDNNNISPNSDIYDPEGPIEPISPVDSPPLSLIDETAYNKIQYRHAHEDNAKGNDLGDDDVPSSAVQLNQQEKYLQKLNRQERVIEEVKIALKPHYQKRYISKEQYKDVLRKAVPKVRLIFSLCKTLHKLLSIFI